MSVRVIHADSRDTVKTLDDASIDSVVCDPPYALVSIAKRWGPGCAPPVKEGVYSRATSGFMGKQWDTGETAFDPAFWVEVLRVLKPGGHLIAFGGTRTYHRLVCAIEDAGFEIRDQLAWLFGSGFPKSHDVSKGIDRAAGADREVIGTYTARGFSEVSPTDDGRNQWAAGVVVDKTAARTAPATAAAREWQGWGSALKPAHEPIVLARKPLVGTIAANVLKHGTGALNIDACRIEASGRPAREIDPKASANGAVYQGRQTAGTGFDGGSKAVGTTDLGRWPANVIHDGSPEVLAGFPEQNSGGTPAFRSADKFRSVYGSFNGAEVENGIGSSAGSAARFFYTPKADKLDRLESKHPTVKPVDLMAYLIKLVTPPGGVVLDPFAGSGTTGMAAMREGFSAILIEREAEYVADINRRLAHVHGHDTPLFAEPKPKAEQLSLLATDGRAA